jgi:serine/threonine-protein kinase MRCK
MAPALSVKKLIEVVISELEAAMQQMESETKEMNSLKRDLEFAESEKTNKLKDFEKQIMTFKLEKEDMARDLTDAQEKLKLQSKELKDALQQRKLAMTEYTEVTDKLSELRQTKQKLSRQVRDKEEELDNSLQKIDSLRQDIRKAEKLRRELELRTEESITEATKEKTLREKSDSQIKRLEKDMASIKTGSLNMTGGLGGDADVIRLKSEVERLEVATHETLLAQQAKHNMEISSLRDQLDDSERRMMASDHDMSALREKLDQTRLDSLQESEETMSELKNVYEREKIMFLEENKKLQFDLERTAEVNSRLTLERRQFEDEYHELRNKKEAVAQWEAQISEIINW